ncbi:MAG TPA: TPM domain-containing protein, partial [Bacteroidetes bacterium]|nr:TPM domain-containing protein [Bacteroidota bacterium]
IPPRPNTAVTDYIGLLNASQKNALEQKLKVFNDTSSSAIVIVIDDSTEGEDIFEYSYKLASKWGIGSKGKDNGILIYIAFNDRKIFIQVGSGLEGAVPDAVAKRIIENVIKPNFRKQNYYAGIDKATDIIMSLSSGEFTADEYLQNDSSDIVAMIIFFLIVFIFIAIIISMIRCKKSGNCNDGGGYSGHGRYNSGGGWLIGGGGFGGSSGGSSFGGGGFGGFSGGGFSGGGAGGGW